LHLDFDVPDMDEGEKAVLALGARKAEAQPGTTWRVYLDPAGHPFCLVEE
ncbi:MAG TPA: VOC family protein, partial [Acidimicrobiia bacterium]|nr:VOC family protein [Acidimicrobiia bacterium]